MTPYWMIFANINKLIAWQFKEGSSILRNAVHFNE